MTRLAASSSRGWQLRQIVVPAGTLAGAEYVDCAQSAPHTGPAVVLLHGFTGSHRSWDGIAAVLAGAHRVLAFDLPGHGASDFGGTDGAHSMESVAAALERGFDAFDVEAAAVIGYSMGARCGLYFALTRPRRVARLVLESGGPGLATAAERRARREADEELAAFAMARGIEAFVDRWETVPVLAGERRLPPAVRHTLRHQRLQCSVAGLAASLRGMGTGRQPWLADWLGTLAVPSLLIAGADDGKFAAVARAMHSAVPRADLAIIPGTGHNVHLERPGVFARTVLRFLSASWPAPRTLPREEKL